MADKKLLDTGIFTRPSTAVKNFAVNMLDYAMLGPQQVINRVPLLHQRMIYVANIMDNISTALMSGTLTEKFLSNLDIYKNAISHLKEISKKTYFELQREILDRHHDLDAVLIIKDNESRNRSKVKIDFKNQVKVDAFRSLTSKYFYVDIHDDSTLSENSFKRAVKEAEELSSNIEDYDRYMESLDKVLRPVVDIRTSKAEIPVLVYASIDSEIKEAIDAKIERGLLQTRERWYETVWLEAENDFERTLAKQQKSDKERIKEEVARKAYGNIDVLGLPTTVLQKLGLV